MRKLVFRFLFVTSEKIDKEKVKHWATFSEFKNEIEIYSYEKHKEKVKPERTF
jgi:hypothetical protein